MNRRSFLKYVGVTVTGFVVPEIILPEKKLWFLGGVRGFNEIPDRSSEGDSMFVQWHVDRQIPVPPDHYILEKTIVVADNGMLSLHGSTLHNLADIGIRFDRPIDPSRDYVQYRMFQRHPDAGKPGVVPDESYHFISTLFFYTHS